MKSLDDSPSPTPHRQPATTVNLRELATAAGWDRSGRVDGPGLFAERTRPCEPLQYCEM